MRMTKRALIWGSALLVVLVCIGSLWNVLALHHYAAVAGIPGKLYAVNGRTMHIYCTGQGSPTILLEAGLGNDSMIWGKNQPELSKLTQVCSYDRAGFGWSEARPGVRDSNAISAELHGLLQEAGIAGPIILMGHSIAGIHMRNYAAAYPLQVKGIVFIDGSTPQQDRYMPPALEAKQKQAVDILYPLVKTATAVGLMRAIGQCTQVQPGMEAYAAWIRADSCNPSQYTSIKAEMAGIVPSGDETVHADNFGDLPILIFSQDPARKNPLLSQNLSGQLSVIWNGMQEDLKKLSTNSRRIIAKGSTHYVQIDRSELVNREVATYLQDLRNGTISPQNGTTTQQ